MDRLLERSAPIGQLEQAAEHPERLGSGYPLIDLPTRHVVDLPVVTDPVVKDSRCVRIAMLVHDNEHEKTPQVRDIDHRTVSRCARYPGTLDCRYRHYLWGWRQS